MDIPDESLIAKYLNNEISDKERLEFERWISLSEKNYNELEKHKLILKNSDIYFHMKHFNTNSAWNKISDKLKIHNLQTYRKRYSISNKFYKYAAIIILALLFGYFGYKTFKREFYPLYSEIKSGTVKDINEYVLPYGSVVTLNLNSYLRYPRQFKSTSREVTLSGEAFFDIKPDSEKPFVINAGNALIRVLGTSFDLLAYPDNETLEVIVESGIVEMICKNNGKIDSLANITLHQGEKGTFIESEQKIEKSLNTDPNFLAWKTQHLRFNNSKLDEVTSCLERIYDVDIKLQNEGMNNLKLTAEFDKKPIDFIMNVIKLTFNLELTQTGDKYILSEHKKVNKNNL